MKDRNALLYSVACAHAAHFLFYYFETNTANAEGARANDEGAIGSNLLTRFSTLSVIANYIFTMNLFSGNFYSFCNP